MDPVVRRKIPSCVHVLLTDIRPKEEENISDWPETDNQSITIKDGITLPRRCTSETHLKPAEGKEDRSTEEGPSPIKPCGLCFCKPSCYTCPRCNISYCGLACYKSQSHLKCSEEFYKESVLEELKSRGGTDEESKRNMQEILLRLRQSADAEGGMESFLKNLEEDGTSVSEGDAHALDLLAKLAEIQSDGDDKVHEVQEILAQLEKGNDDEEADLSEKLAGLDVDSLSEEQLWSLLSAQEKQKFESLVKDGSIAGLVTIWTAWWEQHESDTKTLVEEVDPEHTEEPKEKKGKVKKAGSKDKSQIPPISPKIPPLQTLTSKPSPLVQYNLINALYGYTFSLCLFNGDISDMLLEFTQAVISISECLGVGRAFNSVSEALDAGIRAVSSGGFFDRQDSSASLRAVQAVAHVLTGKSQDDTVGYCLSALSQLRSALSKTKATVAQEDQETRRLCFQAGKKCQFFQAWVKENPKALRCLAGCVWMEYESREEERGRLEKDRKLLEVTQGKSRGKSVMIEEIG